MNALIDTIKHAHAVREYVTSQYPDDPELLADMIEGETDIYKMIDWAIAKYGDALAMAEAVDMRLKKLADRKKSFERDAEKMRDLIKMMMDASGLRQHKGAEATLSIKDAPRSVIITDENKIPDEYKKITTTIKKKEISDSLKIGVAVDGAELSNGGEVLQIRF